MTWPHGFELILHNGVDDLVRFCAKNAWACDHGASMYLKRFGCGENTLAYLVALWLCR